MESFLRRQIFLRYGLPIMVVVDGGSEFKKEVVEILKRLGVDRISISPYNSRANGVNEAGHIPIAAALAKMTNGIGKRWREMLHYVLFAERTVIRGPIGRTPFSLVHNYNPISLIENDVQT